MNVLSHTHETRMYYSPVYFYMEYIGDWRQNKEIPLSSEHRTAKENSSVAINFIQGVYKRMVRFQKLIRNLFLTLHGHNVHHQQRKLSKFLMRYQPFASHA